MVDMLIVWIVVGALALIIELAFTSLTSIWFVVGAIVALVLELLGLNLYVQIIAFLVTSLVLIIPFKKYYSNKIKSKLVKTNVESLIGLEAKVLSGFGDECSGRVTLNSIDWLSSSEDRLVAGDIVIVKAVSGVKLIVEKK